MRAYQFSLASLMAGVTAAGFLSRLLPGIIRDAAALLASGDGHWFWLLCVASLALATGLVLVLK